MEKPDLAMNQDVETSLSIIVKWAGKEYVFQDLCSKMTVRELKERIREATNVLPERQRLLNLRHKGKAADDDVTLGAIPVKHNSKIMMMGSSEEVIKQATDQVPDQDDNVINDFDEKWAQELATEHRQEYLAKVEQRVQNYQVAVLHPPRPDKKLLVLDIDYTLFDHRSVAESGQELMRPFLHEFLASAYEDYDIVIWSATSMKWIEEKMKLLGCDKHPDYKLSFYLDYHAMISIHSPKYGVIEVKPLGVIWKKFPQYSKSNTIMFDDLQRNFLMNPSNGLKIRAFKKAHLSRSSDRELIKLTSYLKLISTMPTFEGLDHSKWESLIRK